MKSAISDKNEVPHDPLEAFRQVVFTYGVEDMAAELTMKKGSLYNKCEADLESRHQPSLRDVVAVTRISGDLRILDSLNRLFSLATFDATPVGPVSDEALLELLCRVGSEQGQMHKALLTALADGRFCESDRRAVRAEAFDLIAAIMAFLQRVEGLVDD